MTFLSLFRENISTFAAMKKLLYTLLLSAMTLVVVAQKPSANSTMVFDSQQYDFGTIKEVDGAVTHIFKFKNSGTTPFVIEAISVSCGCTTPEYSRAPIMPGKSGEIKITFDPDMRPGKFIKEVYIVSNNRKNVNTLKIKGNVVAKPRTVADDYPYELISGVRLSGTMCNFGYIGQGETRAQVIGLANTSSRTVSVEVRAENPTPFFSVSVPRDICAGCYADITFNYNLARGPLWGYMNDKSYIYVNGKRIDTPLSSTAIAADNFAGLNKEFAPRALFSSLVHNFGTVSAGTPLSFDVTMTNDGKSTLIVRSVKPSQGCTTTLTAGVSLEPDESKRFRVDFTPEALGRATASVVIIVNDPERAMRELRLTAEVK